MLFKSKNFHKVKAHLVFFFTFLGTYLPTVFTVNFIRLNHPIPESGLEMY